MPDICLPETTWIDSSPSTINTLLNQIKCQWRQPVTIRVSAPRSQSITLKITDKVLLENLLHDNSFRVQEKAFGEWTLYFATGYRPAVAAHIGTPFVAYFSEQLRSVVFFGDTDYGLLRSTMIGLASYNNLLQGYLPLHAAWFELRGHSYLVIGGHGTGKSLFMFSVLSFSGKDETVRIHTDDWLFFSFLDGESLPTLWSHPTISLTPRDYSTWNHTFRVPLSLNFSSGRKVYIHPDLVFETASKKEAAPLAKIVILRPGFSIPASISELTMNELFRLEREINYHVPDTDRSNPVCLEGWRRLLRSVNTVVVGTEWLTSKVISKRSSEILHLLESI